MKIYGGYLECDHEGDVRHIIWTGTLTNERVLQSLIGAGMRIFSGSAKSRGFCLTRTDLVNGPDPLRYFWTNIGGWGSLFPMINSSESAYFVA